MNVALAHLRAGDADRAFATLEAIDLRDGAWFATRGKICLSVGHPKEARSALETARSLGDESPETFLNLAIAEEKSGNTARARDLLQCVMYRCATWDEPWVRMAEMLRRNGEMTAAADMYAQALERNPLRDDALVGLAVLRLGCGDAAGAQSLLLQCVGQNPERAEAWDALGMALLETGDPAAAEAAFGQAQQRLPCRFDYAMRRANAAFAAGNVIAELARLASMAQSDPLNATLPVARAVLLDKSGRRAEALDALEAAVALAPQATEPMLLLADMLTRSTRGAEAVCVLRQALALNPNDRQIANNLGAVLMRQHQHGEAARVLRDLRERHGDDPVSLCNLANVTALLGEQKEAVAVAQAAIAAGPDAVLPYRALANVLPYHPDVTSGAVTAALQALSARLPRLAPSFHNTPDANRRLRIGLLSGSLRTHPVGWLTVAGFENLDPVAHDIICLVQNTSMDPIARRFRAIASAWHEIDQLDDSSLGAFARALDIDILIDLGGYGDAGRMAACAQRLAPVQIKWVGMQSHSTALAEMDWFITDRWETPGGFQELYTERMLRLPDGYVCYSPPAHAPDVTPLPALTNGHITFGCFNNLAKITRSVIGTWCAILSDVPNSRLVMKTHQLSDSDIQAAIRQKFMAYGLDASRIELRGASPHREFLAQYGDIDIVLDPFPYSGGLTTCEALWMGVPTITLPGEIFSSRHSVSHLSNVGLGDWVARDRQDYVRLAVTKAADITMLADLRARLRGITRASPLCDGARFGRHLGAALRHAWRDWCFRAVESCGN